MSSDRTVARGVAASVDFAWIAAPVAAAAAFYLWNFSDLFPLIEYRQWIEDSDLHAALHFFYRVAILHGETGFSRTTSFVAVALFASACGHTIACHNVLHIALLLGAAVLLGLTLMRQSEHRHPALVAAVLVFFLFSIPVLDAIAWQATILDKCAVLLAALFTWYVARPRLPRVLDQVVLLALTILTVNAKEAPWVVLPSVMLLALVQRLEHAPSVARALPAATGWVLARFALALAYAVMHIGLVMAKLFADSAELARVTSGPAIANLMAYAGFLLGAASICAAVVGAGALAAWRASRRTRLMLLWAAVSFAAAFAMPLKTSTQEAFYLLVPLFYLAAGLFWIVVGIAEAAGPRARVSLPVVVLVLVILCVGNFARSAPGAGLAFAQLSRNFQQALAAVRIEVARDPPQSVTFRADGQPWAFKFFGSTGGSALAPYLAPPGATREEIAALRRAIDAPAAPGLQVRLHADMSLESITRAP